MPDTLFGFDDNEQARAREARANANAPLAARMRPRRLDEVVGHRHLLGEGGPGGAGPPGTSDAPLRRAIESDTLSSAILWGPPGSGKTSLAHVVTSATKGSYVELSAVTAGVKDVRRVVEDARALRDASGKRTVLFLDEIHRFNKAQQDALLPGVEDGSVTLVGATTENPYFSLNAPLLSRSILYRLEPLEDDDIRTLIERAIADERGLSGHEVEADAIDVLVAAADGDARVALNALEAAAGLAEPVTVDAVRAALARPHLHYDREGDNHYDQVSAFIKSMRGSDPDAAVYWLVRMIETGEDPRFLARRMVILAGEDIGLADPEALHVAVAAFQALEFVGLPEARFALAEAAIYLALAPKSNTVTTALARADEAVARLGNAPVPVHLRDAHYKGAGKLGHGAGYIYPHDDPRGWAAQRHLPDGLDEGDLYRPGPHGREPRLNEWRRTRDED